MILLINGAFGIGKTTVARLLVRRLPRAVLFNPEVIGSALQLVRRVDDFQDLRAWRRLTILALRVTRRLYPNVIVPMAFSNLEYLDEIRRGISRFEPRVLHFCLVAPVEVVHERQLHRDANARDLPWQQRRAAECCAVHSHAEFAAHVNTVGREPEEIADELLQNV